MLKNIGILLLSAGLFWGCSKQNWIANFYMLQAETAIDKAAAQKMKKVPFEKRVLFYGRACENFAKAYERNPNVFTLGKIEMAADSCWKAGNPDFEALFREFEEAYIKDHPQEYEHGDSGVAMMEM